MRRIPPTDEGPAEGAADPSGPAPRGARPEAGGGTPPRPALPAPRRCSWRLVGASVAGSAHERRGVGREDAWAARCTPDGALLLAAADGAGSAPRAAEGAALAVAAALDALAARPAPHEAAPWRARLDEGLLAARRALEAAGDGDPRPLACTLLLAAVRPPWIALLGLGDGMAALRRADGRWLRPLPPTRGEHAGETVFVSSRDPRAQARLAVGPSRGVTALALLTDGLEPVAADVRSGAPHAPFLDPLAAFAADPARSERAASRELAGFLASPRVRARCDDDLTLLVAARGPAGSADGP